MAKKPATAPTPPQPVELPELKAAIDAFEKAAPKVVSQEGEEIEVPAASLEAAVNVIALLRSTIKQIDDDAKALIEKSVPADVAAKLARIDKEKKALKKKAEAAENMIRTGLMSSLALGIIPSEGVTTKDGCKLTIASKDAIEITDKDALGIEFVELVPNMAAIKAALESDQRRRDAAKELDLPEPEPTIHGAHLTKSFYFITKTPDVIEET